MSKHSHLSPTLGGVYLTICCQFFWLFIQVQLLSSL